MKHLTLSELKELHGKTTPGEWKRHHNKRFWVCLPEDREYSEAEHDGNAEFCVAAHNEMPRLLEMIEKAEKQLTQAQLMFQVQFKEEAIVEWFEETAQLLAEIRGEK